MFKSCLKFDGWAAPAPRPGGSRPQLHWQYLYPASPLPAPLPAVWGGVAKESNMDWAAVEEMMPIFEAANLIMYRDGVVYFI